MLLKFGNQIIHRDIIKYVQLNADKIYIFIHGQERGIRIDAEPLLSAARWFFGQGVIDVEALYGKKDAVEREMKEKQGQFYAEQQAKNMAQGAVGKVVQMPRGFEPPPMVPGVTV